MINDKKVLALIPARGGSKGLPRKNIIELNGKPLIAWPISAAKSSKYIDKIIVSTDDSEIASVAKKEGAEVPFMRPSELASDTATGVSVILHAISEMQKNGFHFDYIVLLEPTSPLTEAYDVDKALESLHSKRDLADSIVGVSKVEAAHPVFDVEITDNGLIKPYMADDFKFVRRQDISDLYFFEGTLYISDISVFLTKEGFYHERTLPYVVPRWKAIEIDERIDLLYAETIMKNVNIIKGVVLS